MVIGLADAEDRRAEPRPSEVVIQGAIPTDEPWPALRSRVADITALVLMLLTALAVFLFIHEYGMNIVYDDQLMDVALVHQALHGTLTFSALWAQHNENRILIPNLVVVAIGVTTHLQVLVEEYLSGIALCASTALLVLAHRRRSPATPWIVYCPFVAVCLSCAVTVDAVFGFNLSWFLVLLALAVAIFLADRIALGRWALAGAVAAAVAGSFSSLQGLLIWPAVLVVLIIRNRSVAALVTWIGAAAATTVVYFLNFSFVATGTRGHPGLQTELAFFVTETGNVFGGRTSGTILWVIGLLTLAMALVALVVGLRRGAQNGAGVGVALVVFGLAFDATAAIGRSQLGIATAVRYAPFALPVWSGTYLVLMSWVFERSRHVRLTAADANEGADGSGQVRPTGMPEPVRWRMAAAGLLVAVMGIQVLQSWVWGNSSARGWRTSELTVANVTANITRAPDAMVAAKLGTYPVATTRALVGYARQDRLSLFAVSLATDQVRHGLDRDLLTTMLRPHSGERLSGQALLDAGVMTNRPARVQFETSGGGRPTHVVATGKATVVGYLAAWDTTSLPNGVYRLRSRTTLTNGAVYLSPWIVVRVANR